MKKTYEKPMIVFEDFSLCTNIAAGCEVKTETWGNKTCGMDFSGVMIFLDTMTGCVEKVDSVGGDGDYNGICYHVPYGTNLFNS